MAAPLAHGWIMSSLVFIAFANYSRCESSASVKTPFIFKNFTPFHKKEASFSLRIKCKEWCTEFFQPRMINIHFRIYIFNAIPVRTVLFPESHTHVFLCGLAFLFWLYIYCINPSPLNRAPELQHIPVLPVRLGHLQLLLL